MLYGHGNAGFDPHDDDLSLDDLIEEANALQSATAYIGGQYIDVLLLERNGDYWLVEPVGDDELVALFREDPEYFRVYERHVDYVLERG